MKRLLLITALMLPATTMAVPPMGIPTTDPAAFAQRLAEFAANVERWRSMLRDAAATVDQLDETYEALTNVTNLHDVVRNPILRDLLPDDYLSIYNDAMRLGVGALFGESLDLYNVGLIRDVCLLVEAGAEQTNCQAEQTAPYAYMSTANSIYRNVSERSSHIESLTDKMSDMTNLKEIMDLQAMIQTEIAVIQNESLRADALRMSYEANQVAIQQQQDQIAAEMWEVRQGLDLEPVGFED